jgi:A/G-specific adenine glycosylase
LIAGIITSVHHAFIQTVYDYYHQHHRDLPWRNPESNGDFDPYKIMVSEIMLQQTQVSRVIEKYRQFLAAFPSIETLAAAPLTDVLFVWQGLGYNRRGKYLREAAKEITHRHNGVVPSDPKVLSALPGIGVNTAHAIAVYSFNQPLVFIETNIRSVYLHHFFDGHESVNDALILPLVTETLDTDNPREWYWALMDYGTHIKKTYGNPNVRSRHYAKQSRFKGSERELRGAVVKLLTLSDYSRSELQKEVVDARLPTILNKLILEGLIVDKGGRLQIAD